MKIEKEAQWQQGRREREETERQRLWYKQRGGERGRGLKDEQIAFRCVSEPKCCALIYQPVRIYSESSQGDHMLDAT